MTEKQFLSELRKRNIYYFRSGNNIMLNCIFHSEKTPSLGVDFKKRVFHCFTCGAVGNITKLKKALFEGEIEIEEDFREDEVVGILNSTTRLRERLRNINVESSELMIKVLISSDFFKKFSPVAGHLEYTVYLFSRNIVPDSWKKWDIRCGEWKGVKRVLIPMYDEYKRLIAIYGRSLEGDKYLRIRKSKNSDVGKILFGFEHLRGKRKVVLVEGEFDAIYLQQFGIPAVSIGTKKPTEIQLMKMAKYFSEVTLSLDGDVPERTQKVKGKLILGLNDIKKSISEVVPVKVINLPKDKDPNKLNVKEVKLFFKEFIK